MQVLSQNESDFVLSGLENEIRLDGRKLMDSRNIKVIFGNNVGEIEVLIGDTHIITKTTAEIIQPKQEKPNEGSLKFNVDLSSMQDEQQPNNVNIKKYSNEIQKLLEKIIKGSKAIDMESLCIVTNKRVWSINVDSSVVSNGGNLIDAIYLSVIISLLHFRKPYVSVEQQSNIKIHTEKNPQPLSIHHIPIPFTFAFFKKSTLLVSDPLVLEEQIMEGRLTISVNIYNDVCNIHKPGGAPIKLELINKLVEVCLNKIKQMTDFVRQILKECNKHSINQIKEESKIITLNFPQIVSASQTSNQIPSNKMEEEEEQYKVSKEEIKNLLESRN
ncbi:3' exoribonuclease family 1 protein (macronuclear) [Tetrahymena thermophila SB210]|uniref:3' exoribonuclease family 1 protein n=1 Tax=Tetrahymena thermophila (strain SB210) TaxID=312017 RepID=Q23PW9_TETTS|nr:3' exoribonuclease family 1 protein [Tetrahymena thermophila SB210]EAR98566.2 3' exoribonuclease family 1 protein [Tetrahymena thermophila SB210]|eukprot:XP_001018811.2 3' exoribonuclease family 1 protein [Tetrahymena thermophila SB210]